MLTRHVITAGVLALAATACAGSSEEGSSPPDEDQTTETEEAQAGDTGEPEQTDAAENGEVEPPETTLPEVGSVIEGTAVATSAGGDEACRAGDDPEGGLLPPGLVEGAPVTIRDAATGEEIGAGQVTSTDFVQQPQDPSGNPPPWTCTFFISASVSATPEAITIQIAGLEPLPATLDSNGNFTLTLPGVDPGIPTDTTPPTVSSTTFVTLPSQT